MLPVKIEIPENLPAYAIEWVGAKFNQAPVSSFSRYELTDSCHKIITEAHFDDGNGGGTDENVLTFQTQALIKELSGKFSVLTIPEIQRAFKMGIRQEFGKYFGLCPKTYHQFLKGYMSHPERLRAQTEYLKLIEDQTFKRSEKPIGEKMKESKDSCIRVFGEYKESGKMPYNSFAYYNILLEEKVFNWTKEDRKEIKTQAEAEYTSKLKEDVANRIIKKSEYEMIIANLDETNRSLINVCKKVALKKYFDLRIKENKNLWD